MVSPVLQEDNWPPGGEAPDGPTVMRQWFAAMHAHLPTLATRIDTARTEAAQQARREAAALRRASELRLVVGQLQTEQQLRRHIIGQAPQRHASDEAARAALQRVRQHIAQDTQQTANGTHDRAPASAPTCDRRLDEYRLRLVHH